MESNSDSFKFVQGHKQIQWFPAWLELLIQWDLWIAALLNKDILWNKDTIRSSMAVFSGWNEDTFELGTLLAGSNGVLISQVSLQFSQFNSLFILIIIIIITLMCVDAVCMCSETPKRNEGLPGSSLCRPVPIILMPYHAPHTSTATGWANPRFALSLCGQYLASMYLQITVKSVLTANSL
jgi:hypothetical protein